ncbi:MAG: flagellin [Planctomycetota bacterium]
MSRINTNVQSLIAQRSLGQNNAALNQTLERLSTGLQINRGKDDPAGLIASENLRSELAATNAAISNAERADQVVNIAEGGLQEVSGLLTELQGLLTATASEAGLSEEEKNANQLQIDSILQTIDRIAGSTNFQGEKLLNGNYDYQVDNVDTGIESFQVRGAKFNSTSQAVDLIVTQSAQQAGLYLSFGGDINLQGAQGSNFTIELTGSLGSREFTFASGTTLATVANTINTFSEVTGLVATASGTGVSVQSSEYGSDEFVSVRVTGDANIDNANLGLYDFQAADATAVNTTRVSQFAALNNEYRDLGQDLGATINGVTATSNGRDASINTDFLDVSITLDVANSQQLGRVDAFDITGGGADFQLAADVDIAGKVSLGIQDVSVRKLGLSVANPGAADQVKYFLDDLGQGQPLNVVEGDLVEAQKVVGNAIAEISALRGRLGAFQRNTVGATVRSLQIAVENTAAAESVIRDADFASETAELTRAQILTNAATNSLSLANQSPQQVLQLLG